MTPLRRQMFDQVNWSDTATRETKQSQRLQQMVR